MPEALEKWSVELFINLLPRHLELIYLINHFFLEDVRKKYPKDYYRHSRMSIIEESSPKMIRMANLCIICSHCVNGVAELHSELLRKTLFKDFDEYFPGKFINITNGVTPRRWIHCAFPELSSLITEYYGNKDWLSELTILENLPKQINENKQTSEFIRKFSEVKLIAKRRLKYWVKHNLGLDINENCLFDVQVKRIHEYKRQLLNALYCIYRYLMLKEANHEERKNFVKRVTFFGGKAAPGYVIAKSIIRLINQISRVINNDTETNQYFMVVFLPDYKISLAQIIIPAADLSQHISTAGTEASGTSNMKFAMTGSLIIGTRDGANIEIAKEIGEDNVFYFGYDVENVYKIRSEMKNKNNILGKRLKRVFDELFAGKFGDISYIKEYLYNIINGGDFYLVCYDFYSYLEAQEKVDTNYKDITSWYKKALLSISKMGFFSSDRSIKEYSDKIWKLQPVEVLQPSLDASKHVISCSNLKKIDKIN